MSAWGPGLFDNDAAQDFLHEIIQSRDATIVLKQFDSVIRSQLTYIDADLGSVVMAAAGIVAASRGHYCSEFPSDLDVSRLLPLSVLQNAAAAALASVEIVQQESELADLWKQGTEGDQWIANVQWVKTVLGERVKKCSATISVSL